MILLLLGAVHLELSPIYLADLAKKKQMLELVNHYIKKDDNRHSEFMIAQKALNKEMTATERLLSCSQARQSVLDSTISSGKGQ